MEDTTKKLSGRKRAFIAGGSLLGVAALITAAAFTDSAYLNLGNGAGGDGIGGGDNAFNIQVVNTDATTNLPLASTFAEAKAGNIWQEASEPGANGVTIGIAGADTITPGDTVSTSIPFINDSPKLAGALTFSLADSPKGTSSVTPAGETKSMAELLRYTVTVKDATGATVSTIADQTQAQVANLALGDYAAGDGGTVELSVTWSTDGIVDANNYKGSVAYVQAQFGAESL
jgi:hypothetical protein